MIAFLLFTALVSAIAAVFQYFWQNRHFYKLFNKLPDAVPHLPIIGIGHKFFMADAKKLFEAALYCTKPGPSPRRIYAGPLCYVIVDDAEQFQKVYASRHCTDKISFYKLFVLKTGQWLVKS
jgi:hypothetical protein